MSDHGITQCECLSAGYWSYSTRKGADGDLGSHPKNRVTISKQRNSSMRGLYQAKGTERSTDWTRVNGRKVNRQISNLRPRLFRATQTGAQQTSCSLQKLRLRSHAKTRLSIRRVTLGNAGKNTAGVDKLVGKIPAARTKLVEALTTTQP